MDLAHLEGVTVEGEITRGLDIPVVMHGGSACGDENIRLCLVQRDPYRRFSPGVAKALHE